MTYFSKFPAIRYQFPDDIIRQIKNITIRPSIIQKVLQTETAFEKYIIQGNETPEDIAFKKYGKTTLHWAVLYANNIFDIHKQWPKNHEQFESYLETKYRTQITITGYKKVLSDAELQTFLEFSGMPANNFTTTIGTGDSEIIVHPYLIQYKESVEDKEPSYITQEQWADPRDAFGNAITYTPDYLLGISVRDWEQMLNDEKKEIILLKPSAVSIMDKELSKIVNE